jgi:hypothetical protein
MEGRRNACRIFIVKGLGRISHGRPTRRRLEDNIKMDIS